MTDEDALKFYEELEKHYGDDLANFEHYPKIFKNQVKLYRYYLERKRENENSD